MNRLVLITVLRLLLPVAICPVATSASFGQDSTFLRPAYPMSVIVKWSPLMLLGEDRSMQAALEFRTGPMWSLQSELGYGGPKLNHEYSQQEIWRSRVEVRHYTGRFRTNRKRNIRVRSEYPLGNYLAFDAFFKQINFVEIWENNQRMASAQRIALGGHFKVGRQWAINSFAKQTTTRFLMDVYAGVGFRFINTQNQRAEEDPDFYCCPTLYNREYPGRDFLPDITAGLKLGFAL